MKVKVAGLKIGIVISTNDPEEVWNAFRFGNVALKAKRITPKPMVHIIKL